MIGDEDPKSSKWRDTLWTAPELSMDNKLIILKLISIIVCSRSRTFNCDGIGLEKVIIVI